MEKEFRHKTINKKNNNLWMYVSLVLGALLIVSLFWGGVNAKSSNAVEEAVDFINNNLLSGGVEASLVEVKEVSGLYQIKIDVGGQEIDSYVTKDGSLLFPQGINIDGTSIPDTQNNQPNINVVEVSVDDDPFIGPEDAPVIIVEFSDFQCPFCSKSVPTVKQILEEYEEEVKIVYRDFPLSFHQNAQKAAEAAECADDQGKFWEYHDVLFENQNALDVESLKEYAVDLNLDGDEFDDCLDSGKYEEEVKNDFQDGQSYGVSGTPAFFINGVSVSGAQPFSVFQQIIEEELAK
ncbi:MAG: DsbA family protein [Nanoarchaeota archaeon]|nr:DsbA family protein [Nanoarchaeota archaeon]